MKSVHRLKPMIAVRLSAEIIALLFCATAPLVATLAGVFVHYPNYVQWVALGACLAAWILLPFYGYIAFSVTVDDVGIAIRSLFEKQICRWREIKSVRLVSSWNSRYVIATSKGKDLTFPVWLSNLDNLVLLIRQTLPANEDGVGGTRHFRHPFVPLAMQITQTVLGLLFAGVFWFFIVQTFLPHSPNLFDRFFIVGFAVLFSLGVVWRSVRLAFMPIEIETSRSELVLISPFYSRRLPWNEIEKITLAPPLLPDGYLLRTRRGQYFLSGTFEASDELADQIVQHSGLTLTTKAT